VATEAALSLIFFVSGAAGLIFEIVWFYRCGLVFGNTVWAASITLSSFMGGLAIGNGILGWYGHRICRPLLAYAVAEVVVAVAGIAVAYALSASTILIVPLSRYVLEHFWLGNAIRLVAAFTALLVPATAMGATLPLLVAERCRWRCGFGSTLGRLYGWNTLGAVCGVLSAEIVLVQRFGVTGSAWIAGLLNGVAAVAAFWLSRRGAPPQTSPVPQSSELVNRSRPTQRPRRPQRRDSQRFLSVLCELCVQTSRFFTGSLAAHAPSRRTTALLLAAFVAGGNLLALEVIWFRFLSMYVLATTLAMSLILASVLAAIGLGGLAASAWLGRGARAVTGLPAVGLLAGCMTVVSYVSFQSLTQGTQVGDWQRILWFAGVLTVPTSLLSGVIFTLIGEMLARDAPPARSATLSGTSGATLSGSPEGRAAAWLTLANTTGAMCGPLVASFVQLPLLGMERAVFALAMSYGLVSVLAMPMVGASRGLPRRELGPDGARAFRASDALVTAVASIAFIAALVAFPFGLMRGTYFTRAAAAYAGDGSEIVATREGPEETIFLMQQSWMGKPVYRRLVTNGFSMSGTSIPAMRYMRDFVYLPMLLHAGPLRRVLVVCYGVGVTAGAATDVPSIESIDIVELSRDVVAMSDLLYVSDRHPLHDSRVRLHLEDGRYFLSTTNDRFDLITGEPPPPRTPGTVNIYTRDYFRLIQDHLADGGIATYWLPVARPDPGTDVDTIVRAFCDVFDDCSLWNATPFDLILVGTRHAGGPVSEAEFERAWQTPVLEARLREVGFEQPEQIGAAFIGDSVFLRELTTHTPALTDDYPQRLRPNPERLSLSDPRYGVEPAVAELYQRVLDPERARRRFATSAFVRRVFPPALIEETLPFFDQQRIINRVLWEGGRPLRLIEDLDAVLTQTSLRTLPLWILGSDDVKQRIGMTSDDGTGTVDYVRGVEALAGRHYAAAASAFAVAERRGFHGVTVRPLLVYALCRDGRVVDARQLAHGAASGSADETHFWNWLHMTFEIGTGS
jgi:spermidine synthase